MAVCTGITAAAVVWMSAIQCHSDWRVDNTSLPSLLEASVRVHGIRGRKRPAACFYNFRSCCSVFSKAF